MEGIPKKFGKEISSGSERIVYEHATDPEHTVMTREGYIRPEKIKQLFYIQRVLTSLYPEHFPTFPQAIVSEDGAGYVTRERIHEKWQTKFVRTVSEYTSRTESLSSFDSFKPYGRDEYTQIFGKIKGELDDLGINLSFDYTNHHNFMKDKETGLWNYVDVPIIKDIPTSEEFDANVESSKLEIDNETVETVRGAVERINILREQTVRNFIDDLLDTEVSETSFRHRGKIIKLIGHSPKELPKILSEFKDLLANTDREATQHTLLAEYDMVEEVYDHLYQIIIYDGRSDEDSEHEVKSSTYSIRTITSLMGALTKSLKEFSESQE